MENKLSSTPANFVDQLVVPGDDVLDLSNMTNQTIKLGGGLRQNFLLDIKGPTLTFLPVLAFEGGTRRNLPKFEAGTLLYVRVVNANLGMNPELSYTDASGKAGEFGVLKDGYMFECSTGLSRMLLSSPTCPVLEALGNKLSFETAVGINGHHD